MRDAFGGAFSIKLMLIFIIIYVFFICIGLNYAKAFRVKNRIINIIEQQEGLNDKAREEIGDYLSERGYSSDCSETASVRCDGCQCVGSDTYGINGYSYNKVSRTIHGGTQTYYVVETYLSFNIPIFNIKFPIAVRGETRVIEK